jgi:hypothetical protein
VFNDMEATQMQTATHHNTDARRAVFEPQPFPPLEQITRPAVPTAQAAYYLDRRPQTLRHWAMKDGTGPIRPLRVNGILAWPVAELRRVLGV